MGIFKRLKTIAFADVHGVLDKAENPVSMLKQQCSFAGGGRTRIRTVKGSEASSCCLIEKHSLSPYSL